MPLGFLGSFLVLPLLRSGCVAFGRCEVELLVATASIELLGYAISSYSHGLIVLSVLLVTASMTFTFVVHCPPGRRIVASYLQQ